MKIRKIIIASIIATILVGCGGEDESTVTAPSKKSGGETLISGRVYDGPIADAQVSITDQRDNIIALTRTDNDGYFSVNVDTDALKGDAFTIIAVKGDIHLRRLVVRDELINQRSDNTTPTKPKILVSHISSLEFAILDTDADNMLSIDEISARNNVTFSSRKILVAALIKEVVDGHRDLDVGYEDTYQYMQSLLAIPDHEELPVNLTDSTFVAMYNETINDPVFESDLVSAGIVPKDIQWTIESVSNVYEDSLSNNQGFPVAIYIENHLPSTWDIVSLSPLKISGSDKCNKLSLYNSYVDSYSHAPQGSNVYGLWSEDLMGCTIHLNLGISINQSGEEMYPALIRVSTANTLYKFSPSLLLASKRVSEGESWDDVTNEINAVFKYEDELDDFVNFRFYQYNDDAAFSRYEASLGFFTNGLDNIEDNAIHWNNFYNDFIDNGLIDTTEGKRSRYKIKKWARTGVLLDPLKEQIQYDFQVPTLQDHGYSYPEWLIFRSSNYKRPKRGKGFWAFDEEDQQQIEVTFNDSGIIEKIAIDKRLLSSAEADYTVQCVNLHPSALVKYGAILCSNIATPDETAEKIIIPVSVVPIACLYEKLDSSGIPSICNLPNIEEESENEDYLITAFEIPLTQVKALTEEDLNKVPAIGTKTLNKDNCAESIEGGNVDCDNPKNWGTTYEKPKVPNAEDDNTADDNAEDDNAEDDNGAPTDPHVVKVGLSKCTGFLTSKVKGLEMCADLDFSLIGKFVYKDTSKFWQMPKVQIYHGFSTELKAKISTGMKVNKEVQVGLDGISVNTELYLAGYDLTSGYFITLKDTDNDNPMFVKPYTVVFFGAYGGVEGKFGLQMALHFSSAGWIKPQAEKPFAATAQKHSVALDVFAEGSASAELRFGISAGAGSSRFAKARASAFLSTGPKIEASGQFNFFNTGNARGSVSPGAGMLARWLTLVNFNADASWFGWKAPDVVSSYVLISEVKAFHTTDSFKFEKINRDGKDKFKIDFTPTITLPPGNKVPTGYFYEMMLYEKKVNCRDETEKRFLISSKTKVDYTWSHNGEATVDYIDIPKGYGDGNGFVGYLCIDMYYQKDDGPKLMQLGEPSGGYIHDGVSTWVRQPRSVYTMPNRDPLFGYGWHNYVEFNNFSPSTINNAFISIKRANVSEDDSDEVQESILDIPLSELTELSKNNRYQVPFEKIIEANLETGAYYLEAVLYDKKTKFKDKIISDIFFYNLEDSTCSFSIDFDTFNLTGSTLDGQDCLNENNEGVGGGFVALTDEQFAKMNSNGPDFTVNQDHKRDPIMKESAVLYYDILSQGEFCPDQEAVLWSDIDNPTYPFFHTDILNPYDRLEEGSSPEISYSATLNGAWVDVQYNMIFRKKRPGGTLKQLVQTKYKVSTLRDQWGNQLYGCRSTWGEEFERCEGDVYDCIAKFPATVNYRLNAARWSRYITRPREQFGETYNSQ